MVLILLRILFVAMMSGLGVTIINTPALMGQSAWTPPLVFGMVMLIAGIVILVDILIPRKKIDAITAVYFGLIVGLAISFMLSMALTPLFPADKLKERPFLTSLKPMVQLLIATVTCYITTSLLLQTRGDFRMILPYVEFKKEVRSSRPYVLDTSAVIDGRIADLLEPGIFDSPLIIPRSVMSEIQNYAESSDRLRRVRGRRGLDILNRLQNNPKIDLKVMDSDLPELLQHPEESRLAILTRQLEGKLITCDYNLSKVAQLHGALSLNLNDLSNALKQVFVTGEQLEVLLVKAGEEPQQGCGYLSDGTMVVVDNGRSEIGKLIRITVTSVLQTSAGRLVFGKMEKKPE